MAASTALWSDGDVESFIHEYYDAWGGTDEDHILSYYADDVVLQIPGTLIEGKEALRDQFVRPFITAFPGNHHLVKNMIFGPGVVTVEFSFEAQHKGPFAGHAATGARIKLPGCGVYEYDSAKRQITAGRIYFDMGTLLQIITDALVDDPQKAEEALQSNEHNLSLITNVIPTLIHVLRSDGSVLYVNQAVLGYTGLTMEDVRKADYRARVFHPEDVERLREERREALTRPVPFENEQRVLGKDGKYRWFLIRYNPLLDEQGRIDRWYVAAFDIEDRKRAEDAQARQAGVRADVSAAFSKPTHLREILRGCTEAIVRHLDAAFARIWMLNKDESMLELQASAGMYTRLDGSYSRIPVGDLKVGWIAQEKKAHLTNEVMNDPRVKDKGWAQDNGMVAFAGYPLVVEDRLIGVVALFARRPLSESILDTLASAADTIAQGIERKRAEEALRRSEASLAEAQRLSKTGSFAWSPATDTKYYSEECYRVLGFEPQAGPPPVEAVWQRVHPDDQARCREVVAKAMRDKVDFELDYRIVHPDKKVRDIHGVGHIVLDGSGEIVEHVGTVVDITERKRAEEALRNALDEIQKSEANLRQVIDALPALAWCNLPDGPNEFLSKRWHEYTGLSPEESHGWGWQASFHPEDLPPLMESWMKMLASGEPDEIEARLRRHDGVYRWFLIRAEPFRDESGKIVRWYGTSTDIDDRKRAEEALQSNERNLSLIINTMPTLAWSALPDGGVDFINQRWLDYTGLSPEQALGWGWAVAVHPDDLNNLAAYWQSIMQTGEPGEIETRFRRFDGEYRWYLFRANAVRDESGTIVKWYGTNIDIDDRKRAEAEVERAYVLLAEAQRLSRTGSFSWRVETDEITWSEEVYRIFRVEQGAPVTLELIGSRVHPEDQAKLNDMIERVRKAVSDFEYEHRLLMPDTSVKYLHLIAHGIRDNEGRLEYIGAVQDVTESKLAEEALNRARSELAHMARVTTLSALTASISHEINQPIAAVITSAGACLRWLNREQPEVQRAREAAMRIEDDGKRAAEIITRLKSFYKKDVSPQRERVSVNEVVGEMLMLLRSEAERHSVVMRTELAADLPSVSADRVQLQQVLMNLMLNGMEAMSERGGELKIGTRREGGEVMVSVSDTGVGIPADKMEEVFNAFFTTKAGGTGMGLAISGTIMESHGGRLWPTVNPGRGATFHFTLPTESEANK
jgi:PAS domain S-box-containing protein